MEHHLLSIRISRLLAFAASFFMCPSWLFSAQPIFNMVPTTNTSFFLSTSGQATVQYQVTNQTKYTRTLVMKAIGGITQVTDDPSYCTNPFVLSSQQSCLLTLTVSGSQIPSHLRGGPEVCKTQSSTNNSPDPFLCSQPSLADQLDITTVSLSAQHAYITNWSGNSISLCTVNSLTGSLINCTVTVSGSPIANPEAITLNAAGTLLYVANSGGHSVSLCQVNTETQAVSDCVNTGSGFNAPDGVVLNSSNTLAYVSNFTGNNVLLCQVDATSGELNNCSATGNDFTGPFGMTINQNNSIIYVVNSSGTVSVCYADTGTGELSCDVQSLGLSLPEGITLSLSGAYAYITDNGTNSVTLCSVDPNSGYLVSCHTTDGTFNGFGNIAFNNLGTLAYIPRLASNQVSVCNVNQRSGELYSCSDSLGTGFDGPSGVLLFPAA